jgi:hypothetical protein
MYTHLLNNLQGQNPRIRADVALILGTVEEPRALQALQQAFTRESDSAAKAAIAWAGKRLQPLPLDHTMNEIFRFFNIDRQIRGNDDRESTIINNIRLNGEIRRQWADFEERQNSDVDITDWQMSRPRFDTDLKITNIGDIVPTRTLPQAPTNSPITTQLQRLSDGTDDRRRAAALDLAQINNPAALPALAQAFHKDSNTKVREAAQQAAKRLYWNAIYWQMAQDGSIKTEMELRAKRWQEQQNAKQQGDPEVLRRATSTSTNPVAKPVANPQDAAEILRRAEENRRNRKR